MEKKKKKINPLFAVAVSTAVAGVYHYVKGNGIFNRSRFKNQHDAVARYVDAHYKGAYYSTIHAISGGWVTIITTADKKKITLTVTKCDDSVYVFKETPIEE